MITLKEMLIFVSLCIPAISWCLESNLVIEKKTPEKSKNFIVSPIVNGLSSQWQKTKNAYTLIKEKYPGTALFILSSITIGALLFSAYKIDCKIENLARSNIPDYDNLLLKINADLEKINSRTYNGVYRLNWGRFYEKYCQSPEIVARLRNLYFTEGIMVVSSIMISAYTLPFGIVLAILEYNDNNIKKDSQKDLA